MSDPTAEDVNAEVIDMMRRGYRETARLLLRSGEQINRLKARIYRCGKTIRRQRESDETTGRLMAEMLTELCTLRELARRVRGGMLHGFVLHKHMGGHETDGAMLLCYDAALLDGLLEAGRRERAR